MELGTVKWVAGAVAVLALEGTALGPNGFERSYTLARPAGERNPDGGRGRILKLISACVSKSSAAEQSCMGCTKTSGKGFISSILFCSSVDRIQ